VFEINNWVIITSNNSICRIIDVEELWEEKYYRVWNPSKNTINRVNSDQIQAIDGATQKNQAGYINYLVTASKIGNVLAHVH
jgi:hypothetical protein